MHTTEKMLFSEYVCVVQCKLTLVQLILIETIIAIQILPLYSRVNKKIVQLSNRRLK